MLRAALLALAAAAAARATPMNGFVLTSYTPGAYSAPPAAAALAEMAATNVRVVQVMATWYVANAVNATAIAPAPASSPTDADVLSAIGSARAAGLAVALKPHIDCADGVWRANIGTAFASEAQWGAFFASYTAFILHFAALAREGGALAGFNVGTELDGTHHREAEWRGVIAAVRGALPGVPLWLGPNHSWNGTQGYRLVRFWDALDYLGVDMYAPLAAHADPTLAEAVAGWAPITGNLSEFHAAQGGAKGFVFAEVGYASYQRAAVDPPGCCEGPPDAATQALLYASFFQAVYRQPWLAGVFWWAWDAGNARAPCSTDFSVAGKAAQGVVAAAYGAGQAAAAEAPPPPPPPPLLLYANGATQLADWSFGASVSLASAEAPCPPHAASCAVNITADYGALALRAATAIDAANYSSLQLDVRLRGRDAGAAYTLQASLCACDDCSACGPQLPAVDLDQFSPGAPCTLPFAWGAQARLRVPLRALLPAGRNATAFKRLQLGGRLGLQFTVDNVYLV